MDAINADGICAGNPLLRQKKMISTRELTNLSLRGISVEVRRINQKNTKNEKWANSLPSAPNKRSDNVIMKRGNL